MNFEVLPNNNTPEEAFSSFIQEARKWAEAADEVTDPDQARAARIKLKSIRVAAEKTRKALKEDAIRIGKAIDGANNILLSIIVPIEKKFEDIEKAEERKMLAIKQSIKDEREAIIASMNQPTHGLDLSNLNDEQWLEYLNDAKAAHTAKLEIQEINMKKAEEQAKAEAEERENQRRENLRLRDEAEAQKAELAKVQAEAKRERERQHAEQEIERMKLIEIQKEAQKLKDAEQERLEKQRLERQAIEDAAKKAAQAPDKEKLLAFAVMIRGLEVPTMSVDEAQSVADEVSNQLRHFAHWIEKQTSVL